MYCQLCTANSGPVTYSASADCVPPMLYPPILCNLLVRFQTAVEGDEEDQLEDVWIKVYAPESRTRTQFLRAV
eukprot:2328255-Rhodomonas_salina.1